MYDSINLSSTSDHDDESLQEEDMKYEEMSESELRKMFNRDEKENGKLFLFRNTEKCQFQLIT